MRYTFPLHPLTIAIISKEYSHCISNGILHLDQAPLLKQQITMPHRHANTKYDRCIHIETKEKNISQQHLINAANFLNKDSMNKVLSFLDICTRYSGKSIRDAVEELYYFYDFDPADFNYETAIKAWQRSGKGEIADIIVDKYREYSMDHLYEYFDEIAPRHLKRINLSGKINKIHVRKIKAYIYHDKMGLPIRKISAMLKLKKSTISDNIIQIRQLEAKST